MAQAKAQVAGVQAQVSQAESVLARAELDAKRSQEPVRRRAARHLQQELDANLAARDVARADLAARKASAAAASRRWPRPTAHAVRRAQKAPPAQLKDAQNQLGYVELRAGRRPHRQAHRGSGPARAARPSSWPPSWSRVWIVANFKETQLER
jgi:membrane fusion protein (multidrug efflux system)